jgi:hypothetical protein
MTEYVQDKVYHLNELKYKGYLKDKVRELTRTSFYFKDMPEAEFSVAFKKAYHQAYLDRCNGFTSKLAFV